MKAFLKVALFLSIIVVIPLLVSSCGNDEQNKAKVEKTAHEKVTKPATVTEAPSETTETKTSETVTPEPATTPTAQQPVANHEKMLGLARKSGCLACHDINKKVVGPPWKDVAARYKGVANIRAKLIAKVSTGGKGNWTDVTGNVPMPPYYPRVSKENIERLVDFVLSL